MPELPEIHLYASFINEWTHGVTFNNTTRNPTGKGPDLLPHLPFSFHILADARGKELRLRLSSATDDREVLVTFKHGLVGKWTTSSDSHTQLRFDSPSGVSLCYTDATRMGSWSIGDFDSGGRGPDPLMDHKKFVAHVVANAQTKAVFASKEICEVMLDQRYFNGIGNYLRAEILHRACINPFERARTVIGDGSSAKAQRFFDMCHTVPNEVVTKRLYKYGDAQQVQQFEAWLTCYGKGLQKKGANNRTIWYTQSQLSGDETEEQGTVEKGIQSTGGDADGSTAAAAFQSDGEFAWAPLKGEKKGAKPLTHLLLVVSVIWKQRLIGPQVRSWLKDMALDGDEMVYCALEAFLADEKRDFEEIADTYNRLHLKAHAC